MRIENPSEARYVKSLTFSPAGHGKTHLLGTAQADERTAPMLMLDFEGGDETLAGLDIDVAKIRSWDDYSEVYEGLTGDHSKMEGSSLKGGERYRSLGIDSISETHVWALLSIVDRKGPSRREPDLIEQGDYGVASTQMRRMLREFRDLPMHVFYTATTKEIEERGVGKVKVPAMAGQMADEVVALMSVVGYLATFPEEDGEGMGRTLILQGTPGFRTKVRMPWKTTAPDVIDYPTITSLLDALQVGDFVPPPEPEEDPEEEGVDVESLTIPELKDELDQREVAYAASDKKNDLVGHLREAIAAEDNDDPRDDGQADPSGGDN